MSQIPSNESDELAIQSVVLQSTPTPPPGPPTGVLDQADQQRSDQADRQVMLSTTTADGVEVNAVGEADKVLILS